MEESSFGIIIEVYRFLKPELLNIFTPYIEQTESNYKLLKIIKDKLRNPIAHLAILYGKISLTEMIEYIDGLSLLCNMKNEDKLEIINLVHETYKL